MRRPSRDGLCVSMPLLKEHVQGCQARKMGSDVDRVVDVGDGEGGQSGQ